MQSQSSLGSRTARGGLVTAVGQVARLLLHFAGITILARMLPPSDHGLAAFAIALHGFCYLFVDLGLGSALVQKAEVDHNQESSIFWLNVSIGLALTLLFASVVAPIVGHLKGSDFAAVLYGVAPAFVLGTPSVVSRAVLQRDMRFIPITVVDVLAPAVGHAVAIVCAANGLGAPSLVYGLCALMATTSLGMMWSSGWRPLWRLRFEDLRGVLKFGGYLTGYAICSAATRTLDRALLGARFGPADLGYYHQGHRIMLVPLAQFQAPMTAVMFPALAHLKEHPRRFADAYVRSVTLLAWCTMPAAAVLAALVPEVVTLLLGPGWEAVEPVLWIFCVAGLVQPVAASTGWVFLALGRTRRLFFWGLVAALTSTTFFLIASGYGAIAMAIAYGAYLLVLFPPLLMVTVADTELTVGRLLRALVRPLLGASAVGVVTYAARYLIGDALPVGPLRSLLLLLLGGGACLLVLWRSGVIATVLGLVRRGPGASEAAPLAPPDNA